jgi:small-conductance mechanosensitive channel
MIENKKEEEVKTITLNDKVYNEKDLNEELRNSIISFNTQKNNKQRLNIDIKNCQVLIDHHSKIIDKEIAKLKPIKG